LRLEFERGHGGAELITASSAEGGLLPAEEYFARICNGTK
jgi:hypothetical protein